MNVIYFRHLFSLLKFWSFRKLSSSSPSVQQLITWRRHFLTFSSRENSSAKESMEKRFLIHFVWNKWTRSSKWCAASGSGTSHSRRHFRCASLALASSFPFSGKRVLRDGLDRTDERVGNGFAFMNHELTYARAQFAFKFLLKFRWNTFSLSSVNRTYRS